MADIQNRAGRFQARPKRVPLHEQRDKMNVKNKDPERVYRWVNDYPGRVEAFKEGGYRVEENVSVGDPAVEDGVSKIGSVVEKHVGHTKAVLMSQNIEDYEADQAAKQKQVDQLDAAMKRDAEDKSDYGELKVSKRR